MIGYAEKEVFTERERELWQRATTLVSFAPYYDTGDEPGNEPVRCHELARAVGKVLDLEHEDGRFGFVEHTWLWTTPCDKKIAPWTLPNVLDVYVPGSMPQVQLVHMATGLPARYMLARVNDLVVRTEVVERLILLFEEKKT
jgi:hypothetical protein